MMNLTKQEHDLVYHVIDVLCIKMEKAAAKAGRTWTDTADLSPAERKQYRQYIKVTQKLRDFDPVS